jgi:hypothetical protein
MPLWVCVLAGAELRVCARAEASCVAAQVDKYRPHSLDKLIVHQDVGENLRNLVRLAARSARLARAPVPPHRHCQRPRRPASAAPPRARPLALCRRGP